MDRRTFIAGGTLLAAVGAARAAEGPWTKPYNGKDLSGWHVQEGTIASWKANGEMISCIAPKGGFLTLDKQYGDFEMRFEYRIPAGGNSGIGVHYPPGGHPSTTGMEIQILDDDAPMHKNLDPAQYNGSVYKLVAPKSRPAKPVGEWNRMTLRFQGPRIRIALNGTEIINVSADDYQTAPHADLTPLAKRPRRGCVGLQSHESNVDFRNIEIREL